MIGEKFHKKVVEQWQRVPRAVESPSLERFKDRQMWHLGTWISLTLVVLGEGLDLILGVFSNLNNSMALFEMLCP